MNNILLDKYKGCLVGLACGDYLGMPYEYKTSHKIREYFKNHALVPLTISLTNGAEVTGFYTDDTALTICLAESLIEHGFDTKDQFRRYKKWLNEGYATPFGGSAFGVGQQTLKVLFNQSERDLPYKLGNNPKAGGNGALMRCAPIGLRYYKDMDEIIEKSIRSAIITHNNIIAAWSCVILNFFIAFALEGTDKTDYCKYVLKMVKGLPPELAELLRTDFTQVKEGQLAISGYSFNTLKIALFSFFTTNTFATSLTKAIATGGDTDTQGAVAGALAGAYYGYDAIPMNWRLSLLRREYIENLAEKLYDKAT